MDRKIYNDCRNSKAALSPFAQLTNRDKAIAKKKIKETAYFDIKAYLVVREVRVAANELLHNSKRLVVVVQNDVCKQLVKCI